MAKRSFEAIGSVNQLGSLVYQEILKSILEDKLLPGSRLNVGRMTRELGVSATPIRDALVRLTDEGLVEKIPYQGYKIRSFSTTDIVAVFEVRAALESYSAALSANRRSDDDLAWLRRAQDIGAKALAEGDYLRYAEYNDQFHQFVIEIPGNGVLVSLWRQMKTQVKLFAKKTIGVKDRPPGAFKEHGAMIEAIAAQDAEEARKLMEHHIMGALEDMLKR